MKPTSCVVADPRRFSKLAAIFMSALLAAPPGAARAAPSPSELRARARNHHIVSLRGQKVPDPPNLSRFVKDRQALRQLGKALFWDQQLGSDGQACASCHFHAGADNRSRNQLDPGLLAGDFSFTAPFGANYVLTAADYPFHLLEDPDDRDSRVIRDTNDVASSMGVFNYMFTGLGAPPAFVDLGAPTGPPFSDVFSVNGTLVRNVEPRHTPPSVNSGFNDRNFWDGRARAIFNGVNPFGDLDSTAKVVRVESTRQGAVAKLVELRVPRLSTASQADGPPLSDLEMSFRGRRFAEVGRKMFDPRLVPLGQQVVAGDDSVLAPLRKASGAGLSKNYLALVRAAFQPEWWSADGWRVDLASGRPVLKKTQGTGPNLFTVAEYNFSLFFGFAVWEYERTLASDQTPLDRFLEGDDGALAPSALAGFDVFLGDGKCANCHGSALLSNASFLYVEREERISRMIMGNGRIAVYDEGFYNVAVRPTAEDIGVGGTAPSGKPLSYARGFQDCVKRLLPKGGGYLAIAAANVACGVPRLHAKPAEAASLIEQANALLADPDLAVKQLVEDAMAAEARSECEPGSRSRLLADAHALLAANPAASAAVKDLLAQAALLLPDKFFPGEGCKLAAFLQPGERVAVDGALKVPTLRNVELSAPYFSNGGTLTLRQVVQFYDRGGDFHRENLPDLDPDITDLGLADGQMDDLVSFLLALTDERVRRDAAPFDHPSLSVPNGGGVTFTLLNGFEVLDDRIELPAVGRNGSPTPLGTAGTAFANFPDPLE